MNVKLSVDVTSTSHSEKISIAKECDSLKSLKQLYNERFHFFHVSAFGNTRSKITSLSILCS